MKTDVDQMVFAGIHPKKLAIQHVRNPGNWMPVERIGVRKSPLDVFPEQSALDHRVLRDVIRIVVIKIFEMADGKVNGQCYARQQHTKQDKRQE